MNSPHRLVFLAGLAVLSSACVIAADSAAASPSAAAPAAAPRVFNFGDHVSTTLVAKAWAAHEAKDSEAVAAYAGKCRELYLAEALKQQAALTEPIPTSDQERIFAQWALNDVGTCLFIQGQTYERDGNVADALVVYKLLVEKLAYAQCWDTKGWFWSPAEAAKARLRAIEFESAGF